MLAVDPTNGAGEVSGEAADGVGGNARVCAIVKALLIDDGHSIVRAGLRRILAALPAVDIFEAANGRDALALVCAERPDFVIVDLALPGVGGFDLLKRILVENPASRVLVFTMEAGALYAGRAIRIGARGYVSKAVSPAELLTAIKRVLAGGHYIENEIAQELALQTIGIHRLR